MEIDHEGEGKGLRCITLSFALLIFFCILLGRGDDSTRRNKVWNKICEWIKLGGTISNATVAWMIILFKIKMFNNEI